MAYVQRPDTDEVRITRYVLGECPPEDRAETAAWIASDPDRRQRAAELIRLRSTGAASATQIAADTDTRGAWTALAHTMPMARRATPVLPLAKSPRMRPGGWAGIAMAAVVVIGVCITWPRLSISIRPSQHVQDIVSAAGSRTTVTLRDGTRIVLGPASRLHVAPDFGRSQRMVELEGEGFFAVVHDSRHPFAVRTRRGDIRDVGTTFVVKAYTDDPEEQVAVEEGQVDMGTAALGAGDIATVSVGKTVVIHHANVALLAAWTQGRLTFEDTPLRDAVREVSRMYGLQVTIPDSALANKLITASFTDESADDVLDAITRAIRARYERLGHTVVIRRQTDSSKPSHSTVPALNIARSSAHS